VREVAKILIHQFQMSDQGVALGNRSQGIGVGCFKLWTIQKGSFLMASCFALTKSMQMIGER